MATVLPAAPPSRPRTLLVASAFGTGGVLMFFGTLFAIYASVRDDARARAGDYTGHLTVTVTNAGSAPIANPLSLWPTDFFSFWMIRFWFSSGFHCHCD